MKKIVINGNFGIENLEIQEQESDNVLPHEIQIKLSAASLNYRDLLMVKGEYNPRQKLPLVPCSDGAGTVTAVGSAVSRFRIGDRVMPVFAQTWQAGSPTLNEIRSTLGGPLDGTLRQNICVPEYSAVKIPAHLSFNEAATLPCAALTAWSALFEYGNLQAGQSVLILGTGGVSVFALQFAKLAGAKTIITSSSSEKLQMMQKLGADHIINYNEKKDWGKEVRKLTGNVGVDYVIEVGGAGTLEQSIRSVRVDGTISLIGILAGRAPELNLLPVLMQNVRIQGILVGSRRAFENMNDAIEMNKLTPLVDRVFPFEEHKEAFLYLQSQKHMGKVVIAIPD
ncbi:MAG: NAD(P)-dependent alcohol dehydrogenase [Leptospiraceae bacterium]|nr:NAD(P)-dependent alcohol dehydrogenase [Leptospiraceae bacterium]